MGLSDGQVTYANMHMHMHIYILINLSQCLFDLICLSPSGCYAATKRKSVYSFLISDLATYSIWIILVPLCSQLHFLENYVYLSFVNET